jgi:hypothetical protein
MTDICLRIEDSNRALCAGHFAKERETQHRNENSHG